MAFIARFIRQTKPAFHSSTSQFIIFPESGQNRPGQTAVVWAIESYMFFLFFCICFSFLSWAKKNSLKIKSWISTTKGSTYSSFLFFSLQFVLLFFFFISKPPPFLSLNHPPSLRSRGSPGDGCSSVLQQTWQSPDKTPCCSMGQSGSFCQVQ